MKSPWQRGSSRPWTPLPQPESLSTRRIFRSRVCTFRYGAKGHLRARPSGCWASSMDSSFLGLPVRLVESDDLPTVSAPALLLRVVLTDSRAGETRGMVVVNSCAAGEAWVPLGKVPFRNTSAISVLDGATLCDVVDRSVASAFVTVKPARRTLGSTTLKVENRLPFTVSNLVVKAGTSAGSPSVPFTGVGVGPARSALLPIQAATASLVEHVELNGL